jgi:hypothetical protein
MGYLKIALKLCERKRKTTNRREELSHSLEMKFYIKAASLKTSRSKVESSLCEEKSTRLVIEFKIHESKDWKCKSS